MAQVSRTRRRHVLALVVACAAAAAPGHALDAASGRANRTPEWGALNVFDFGAVGDGVADDAPAFAAVISAAVARGIGVVVVPRKIWIGSHVNATTCPASSAANPLTFVFPRGGGLHIARAGLELVLHGNLEAGPYQWVFGERARWVGSTIFANSGPGRPEWFGAVADGVTNDEPAISTALALHGDVLFQPKTYAVAARSAPAWSGAIPYGAGTEVEYQGNLYRSLKAANVGQRPDEAAKWWLASPIFAYDARRVSGQHSWREDQGGTVISVIAGGSGRPGGVFGCRSNAGELRDLAILANGRARAGVWLDTSYGAYVENVSVQGATEAGFRFKTAQVSVFRRLFATKNQVGFWIEDGNAARYYDLKAVLNVAEGIRIEAVAMSGGISIYGADLETNNTGRKAAGLTVKNTTTSVELASLWIEESDGGDAIQLDNARFVTLFGSRISGAGNAESSNRAIRLKRGSRGNTLVACKLVSGDGDARYEQIEMEPGSMENSVFGCVRMSQEPGSSAYPARVVYQDRNTIASNHVAWAGAAPVGGYWAVGDVVWNSSADAAVLGWRCVESGTPGVWRPLATRTATGDGAATDVEALRREFNDLLRRLQEAGLMEPKRAR